MAGCNVRQTSRILPNSRKICCLYGWYCENRDGARGGVNRKSVWSTTRFAGVRVSQISHTGGPYGEKGRHLRSFPTAAHIAVAIGRCDSTLDEVVTADCEEISAMLELGVDQSIDATIEHTTLDAVLQTGNRKALG